MDEQRIHELAVAYAHRKADRIIKSEQRKKCNREFFPESHE